MDEDDASVDKSGSDMPKQESESNAGRRKALLAAGMVLVIVAVAVVGVYAGRDTIWPPAKNVVAGSFGEYNTTHMSMPASSVGTTARFYDYNTSGTAVRFFAVKDGNGTIRTAFDECPQCYGKHLGFRQQGNMMVENCCNMSFAIDAIGPGCTGCHPEYLPSRMENGKVMIDKRDIIAGAYLFAKGGPPSGVEEYNMTAVGIPQSSFTSKATWYRYNISGATVRFFAVKDANGTVHTAFDECPMCYGNHLGFRQDGASMVENCCDMPFPIENVTATGCAVMGCHPVFLQSQVDGDRVFIAKSALAAGTYLFKTGNESAGVENLDAANVAIAFSSVGGTARWYEYGINNTIVRFFAVKDANGMVHTSMDICPKCYKKHAGFRQEGNMMVENCCNMGYPIENITAEGCNLTGCHPAILPSHVEGDRIIMSRADLEAGSYMFQSGRR